MLFFFQSLTLNNQILSANQNAYKFRIVEMKDQKDSYRLDTFDGITLFSKIKFKVLKLFSLNLHYQKALYFRRNLKFQHTNKLFVCHFITYYFLFS